MKSLLFSIFFTCTSFFGTAQYGNGCLTRLENGNLRVDGVDPFGAQVVVVYNKLNQKIYQERTYDGETVFVRYEKGRIIELGTIVKPIVESSTVPSFKIGF